MSEESKKSNIIPTNLDINAVINSLDQQIPAELTRIFEELEQIDQAEAALKQIKETINREIAVTKEFSQNFTQHNWSLIKKDIYIIIIVTGFGLILLSFCLIVTWLFLFKYFLA